MEAGEGLGIRSRGKLASRVDCTGVKLARLGVGKGMRRPIPGQDAVIYGLLPRLPLGEVMG
jgi:hypothetical protein